MRPWHARFNVIGLSGICMIQAAVMALAPSAEAETPLHTIPAPGLQSGARLGSSVSVDGGLTVVGAPNDDIGASDSGVVKVFDTQTGALLHVIPNPTPAASDLFGSSVSLDGTMLVVGAPQDDSPGAPNAGCAYLYDLAGATPTQPLFTLQNPTPAGGDAFGSSVAISGSRMVVGAFQDDPGSITDAGSAHVYDLTGETPALLATLSSPNSTESGLFGLSVGVSGTRVVIGAYRENIGSFIIAGRAYVYDFTGGTPPVVTTLENPDPASLDQFGISVAISGMRVAIGASGDDTNAGNAGRAYVYDLADANPSQSAVPLDNPDPAENDFFGISVAISDSRIVVGAHQDDPGPSESGRAYVYELTNLASPYLLANPSPADSDSFGRSIAVSETLVLVGSPNDDTGTMDSGSAYLFDFTGGTPPVLTTLNNPGPNPESRFGRSVAVSGTYMVVGAPQDDVGNLADAGRAYVYDLAGATPTVPLLTLQKPIPAANDQFGTSVAISGTRVVVGAWLDDTGASNAGSAYVYDLASGTPTVPLATLNNPSPAADDWFGSAVAISGARVLIGTYGDDTGADNAGSAYVYDLASGTPTVPTATLNNSSPAADDWFGSAVAISGTSALIGAYGDDTGASNAGSAYVHDLTSGTPEIPLATLNNPSPTADDWFGSAVAISGTRVLIGTYGDDTGADNAGSAYVYDIASGTPTVPTATLNNPNPTADDWFGSAVAISGTRALIGAYGDDTGASNAGSAYVHDLTSGTPEVPLATFNNPSPAADDQFGSSVAITGKTCVIGVPYDDSLAANSGAAYVFGPAAQISVEQPLATVLPEDGAAIDAGEIFVGDDGDSIVFTIRNNGTASLNEIAVTTGGTHAADFVLNTDSTASSLAPGTSTTFSVRFQPAAAGLRNANLSIASANGDVNPFVIALSGTGVLPSIDLVVSPANATEDGATNLVYTFTRSGPTDGTLTVSFDVSGSASFESDYTASGADTFNATTGTVTFAAASSTATVTLDPTADTAFEADETAILAVATGSGYVVGAPNSATATITNDDTEVSVAVSPSSVTEDGATNLVYTFTRSGPTDGTLNVSFDVAGTASFANDYTQSGADTFNATTGTVTFAAASSTATVTLDPTADTTFETDETAILTVAAGSGYVVGAPNSATATITNDDTEVSVAVSPSSVTEDGVTNLVYTFTRSGPSDGTLTVSFDVAGTASFANDYTQSGADTFNATTGTVTFAAASSTATVTLDPTADTAFETDETTILTVATGSGYVVGAPNSATATATITNDDTEVSLAVSLSSVTEDGATNLVYTFTRNGPTTDSLTVSFDVAGTASFASDYTASGADTFNATTGMVTFAAASSTATVTLDPTADTVFEADETAILTVATGSGYVVGAPNSATATITNDDTEVSIAVSPSSVTEDGATNLVYTFSRNGPTTDSLTVSFDVSGSASFESDYTASGADTFNATTGTVTFAAASSTATVTLDPTAETAFEADETTILTVATGSGYVVGAPNSASATITNDDTEVSVAVSPSSVTEDGATNLVYTFTRNGPSDGTLAVSFDVSGTAAFGDDFSQSGAETFSATSGTVIFAAANSTATVTIDPTADTAFETDETAILTVATGSGYVVGALNSATGTITNDDTEVSVAVAPPSVTEDGASNLVYTFTRNGPTAGALAVSFSVQGTAEFATDYSQTGADLFTASSGTVIFADGSATATVTLDPATDTTVETDETAILTITTGSGYNIATPDSATGTITNDDTEPTPRDLFDDYAEDAGLTGENAEPNASPFNDGLSNLIKYAFNMDASGPDTRVLVPTTGEAGLPVLIYTGGSEPKVHYEFIRRKNSGLTYSPLQSTTLANGSWEPMTGTLTITDIGIDEKWERVIILQDHDPVNTPKRFFKMEITLD